jgi:SAM-dependent methyltransferase
MGLLARLRSALAGRDKPYPVDIAPLEARPPEPGPAVFDAPSALEINRARMEHLRSLGLPLAGKSVLDVGAGVGYLARELAGMGCRVHCVEGREDNVAVLKQRHPDIPATVGDAERFDLASLGRFDAVFCYGLLYHLENPIAALRNMAAACGELLLLETTVCDAQAPLLQVLDEPPSSNQALARVGNRPSPAYVAYALNRVGFGHVYAPRVPPEHGDFRFEWRNDLAHWRDGRLLRCIFVASRAPLDNGKLVPLIGR